jgi:Dolichyl-phosphate-mannose-protein mannosyltransferase
MSELPKNSDAGGGGLNPKTLPGAAARWTASRPLVAALMLTGVASALNIWWVLAYRRGYPFDIDEAGYLNIALQQAQAFKQSGIGGFWQIFQNHGAPAPLVPALTTPLMLVFGPHAILGFVVPLAAYAVMALASYGVVRSLTGSSAAALVALVCVCGIPAILEYSRSYNFALPATACFTTAVLCMLRSQGFHRTLQSLGWGISMGLMVLARTMTIAFVPGLVGAAAILILASDRRFRALANVVAGVVLGGAIASIWYIPNRQAVFGYLLSYGYGSHASEYANGVSALSLSRLHEFLNVATNSYLYLPGVLLCFFGVIAGIWVLVAHWHASRDLHLGRKLLSFLTPQLALLIIILEGFLALISTQNGGSGFLDPLLPIGLTLVVVALASVPAARVRALALIGAALVGILGISGKSGLSPFKGAPVSVPVPLIGEATVFTSLGTLQGYEEAAGYGGDTIDRPSGEKNWIGDTSVIARDILLIADEHHIPASCAFAFRDHFVNLNSVNLARLTTGGSYIPATQIDPVSNGTTERDIETWLTTGGAADAGILLTADPSPAEFLPAEDATLVRSASLAAGFVPDTRVLLPNGRQVTLWWRKSPDSAK